MYYRVPSKAPESCSRVYLFVMRVGLLNININIHAGSMYVVIGREWYVSVRHLD